MLVFATKSADVRISINPCRKILSLGNPFDLLTAYVFLWTDPNQLSQYQLILNLKALTQHSSNLVVHMYEISIMFETEMFEILF